jgi:hypothetical protein
MYISVHETGIESLESGYTPKDWESAFYEMVE